MIEGGVSSPMLSVVWQLSTHGFWEFIISAIFASCHFCWTSRASVAATPDVLHTAKCAKTSCHILHSPSTTCTQQNDINCSVFASRYRHTIRTSFVSYYLPETWPLCFRVLLNLVGMTICVVQWGSSVLQILLVFGTSLSFHFPIGTWLFFYIGTCHVTWTLFVDFRSRLK